MSSVWGCLPWHACGTPKEVASWQWELQVNVPVLNTKECEVTSNQMLAEFMREAEIMENMKNDMRVEPKTEPA